MREKYHVGDKIVNDSNDLIITGSPDFLMNPICEYLNIESLSSVVDKNTGIVTIKQLF